MEASRIIDYHKLVGYQLGLSEAEMTAINVNEREQELRRVVMLKRWKQKYAQEATYKKLIEALLSCRRAQQATELCKLLAQSECIYNHTTCSHVPCVHLEHTQQAHLMQLMI